MILLSILILILSIPVGYAITNKLTLHFLPETKWAWIITLGTLSISLLFFLAFLFFGVDIGSKVALSLTIVLALFSLRIDKISLKKSLHFTIFSQKKWFLATLTILSFMLASLLFHHIIDPKSDGLYTGESTYGDLPFHLTTISQIAYAKTFPPENPFYAGLPQVYPYLVNLHSAILVYFGFNLRFAIIIPGILLGTSLIALIYEFSFIITKKYRTAIFATILYFLQGGTGFYYFLKDARFDFFIALETLKIPSAMIEYSHLFRENIQWGNFLTRMIVPERSIIFGIPAGIIALRILFFRGNTTRITWPEKIIASVLLGCMPLIHTHTVLAFAIILPLLTLFFLIKDKNLILLKDMLQVAVLTIAIALPILPIFFGHLNNSEHFFTVHLGWMTNFDKESMFFFWFKNTYLYIPGSIAVLLLSRWFTPQLRFLQSVSLAIFIILNIALFSPYNWDNVKFLFWAGLFWIIASASLADILLQKAKKSFLSIILISFVLFTMISSALLSYHREINLSFMLFSNDDQQIGEFFKKNTDQKSIVLTETIHNSPASNLAGRKITMGYPGSLWVHGIRYQTREQQVKNIFAGAQDARETSNNLNLDYAIVPTFQTETPINQTFFNQFPLVFENQRYKVYKLKN